MASSKKATSNKMGDEDHSASKTINPQENRGKENQSHKSYMSAQLLVTGIHDLECKIVNNDWQPSDDLWIESLNLMQEADRLTSTSQAQPKKDEDYHKKSAESREDDIFGAAIEKKGLIYGQALASSRNNLPAIANLAAERDLLESKHAYMVLQDDLNRKTTKLFLTTEGLDEEKKKFIKVIDVGAAAKGEPWIMSSNNKTAAAELRTLATKISKSYAETVKSTEALQKCKNAAANDLFTKMIEVIDKSLGRHILEEVLDTFMGPILKCDLSSLENSRSRAVSISMEVDPLSSGQPLDAFLEKFQEEQRYRDLLGTGCDFSEAITKADIKSIILGKAEDKMKIMPTRYINLVVEKNKALRLSEVGDQMKINDLKKKLKISEARGNRLEYLQLPGQSVIRDFQEIFPSATFHLLAAKSGREFWQIVYKCYKSADMSKLADRQRLVKLNRLYKDATEKLKTIKEEHRVELLKIENNNDTTPQTSNSISKAKVVQIKQPVAKSHDDFPCPLANLLAKRDREIADKGRELSNINQFVHDQHQKLQSTISDLTTKLNSAQRDLERALKEPDRVREEWSSKLQRKNGKINELEAKLRAEEDLHSITKLDYDTLLAKFEASEKALEKKDKKLGRLKDEYTQGANQVKAQRDKLTTENEDLRGSELRLLQRIAELESRQSIEVKEEPVRSHTPFLQQTEVQSGQLLAPLSKSEQDDKVITRFFETLQAETAGLKALLNSVETGPPTSFENLMKTLEHHFADFDLRKENKRLRTQNEQLLAAVSEAPQTQQPAPHSTEEWLVDPQFVRDLLKEQNRLKDLIATSSQKHIAREVELVRDLEIEKGKLETEKKKLRGIGGRLIEMGLEMENSRSE